jgi:hypothetical protein
MKQIAMAAVLLAAQPADAAACHRFSHWAYPYAQRCGVARQVVRVHQSSSEFIRPPERDAPDELPNFGIDMPLPSLARADCEGGEADDEAKGRLLLRAALEAPNAH